MTKTSKYLSIHKLLVMGLLAMMGITLCAYVSFTVATIFATAGRTAASHEANVLIGQIGELERSYIALEGSITASEAALRGFVTPKSVTLVALKSESMKLSLKTE